MCCEHLGKVCNGCGCRTWACDVDLRILWCFINSDKEILSGWEWATVVNMVCVLYLFRWICHLEGLWGRSGAHNLATEAFAYISLSLNIYARPPDSCLRCCLTLVMPWHPSCANWGMQGRSVSGIIIRLFRRIIPRFWLSSSFRSAKGFGAADQSSQCPGPPWWFSK